MASLPRISKTLVVVAAMALLSTAIRMPALSLSTHGSAGTVSTLREASPIQQDYRTTSPTDEMQERIDTYYRESNFPTADRSPKQKIAQAKAFLQTEIPKTGAVGVGISAVYKDQVVISEGYGKRLSNDSSSAVSKDSLFQIGSVTKTFIALTIGSLVEDGKARLGRHGETALAVVPARGQVRRSRRHDQQFVLDELGLGARSRHRCSDVPLRKTPLYSNTNYDILGQIIEDVSGMSWDTFLSKRLFKPLGMTRTFASTRGVPASLRKSSLNAGHFVCRGRVVGPINAESRDAELALTTPLYAPGSMVSSAADMAQFRRLILNKQTFQSSTTIAAMITGKNVANLDLLQLLETFDQTFGLHYAPDGATLAAGYGIDMIGQLLWGHPYFDKGGDTFVHNNGLGIAILSNSDVSTQLQQCRAYVMGIFLNIPSEVLEFEFRKWRRATDQLTPPVPGAGLPFWKNPPRLSLTPSEREALVGEYSAVRSSRFLPKLKISYVATTNAYVIAMAQRTKSFIYVANIDKFKVFMGTGSDVATKDVVLASMEPSGFVVLNIFRLSSGAHRQTPRAPMAAVSSARLPRLGERDARPATSNANGSADASTSVSSPRGRDDETRDTNSVGPALATSHSRERIAGSPLVPDGVRWADDGRVAVVSEASILISTFMSRELEMYIQQSPAISKSFIFVPDAEQTKHERVPLKVPVFSEPTDASLPAGSLTYFLLHEKDRHQYNPKEVSLSKNDGNAFLAATWGPRGSGPNSSCAMLALTSSSRISLHFSSSFHISWKEVAVFSENLFEFLESRQWTLTSAHATASSSLTPAKHAAVKAEAESLLFTTPTGKAKGGRANAASSGKKRKRLGAPVTNDTVATMPMAEYARRCALVSTLSIAWSPFVTNPEQHTTSLIALCGRAITTVWGYDCPSFEAFAAVDRPATATTPRLPTSSSFLSPTPFVWIDTEKHGWVTTSAWQQLHRLPDQTLADLLLAMGTSEGKVLLAKIPVMPRDMHVSEVAIDRMILAPHLQPVFGLRLGSRHTFTNSDRNNLVVASGSRISVWNLHSMKKRPQPVTWKAHDGNVTGLDVDYFGEKIFSCGVDGQLRLWEAETGKERPYVSSGDNSTARTDPPASSESPAQQPRYPMFGLTVSPNSAQVACMYVIPPAARPNRKSQADVSYSRVSTALEYLPTPYASQSMAFVETMCTILEQGCDMSTMMDVLWFCHEDNAAITSLQGTADLTLPHLLNKLKGIGGGGRNGEDARQPLYLSLCSELETRYFASIENGSSTDAAHLPLFLQGSYLLRSCIAPAEHHIAIRDDALVRIKRSLYVYWAERCLKELLASHSQVQNFADISKTERIAALLMADFLSVQQPMSASVERLVTTIYNRLGSQENIARWSAYLQARVDFADKKRQAAIASGDSTSSEVTTLAVPVPPVPPPRQTCFICDEAVPFGELEQFCVSGHVQDRCFLSFQVLSSMDTWKCMGCGASACEIDFSHGRSPFYLLESSAKKHATAIASAGTMQIVCRLCGNYCSFLRY